MHNNLQQNAYRHRIINYNSHNSSKQGLTKFLTETKMCPQKTTPFYFLNNWNQPTLIIFGIQHFEDTRHLKVISMPTSPKLLVLPRYLGKFTVILPQYLTVNPLIFHIFPKFHNVHCLKTLTGKFFPGHGRPKSNRFVHGWKSIDPANLVQIDLQFFLHYLCTRIPINQ